MIVMEIVFDILYLITIWTMVGIMAYRLSGSPRPDLGRLFMWGFLALALGDTGHVGFRVWAFALGGLEAKVDLFGASLPLVGAGALSTAVTVTLLYVLLLEAWRMRFEKERGAGYWLLVAVAVGRLVLFVFPGNEWGSPVPPFGWALLRNAPLTLLGLSVAVLYLMDGRRTGDRPFTWIGIMILVSYAFYMPVILFVRMVPVLGMLMIPKTLAYVAMAAIALKSYFPKTAGRIG